MEEQTFKTVLRNERRDKGVVLWDRNGSSEGILAPGHSRTLESWNPEAMFSPFSSVTWKEDGTVETMPNPDFPAPKSRWFIAVLNKSGGSIERRIIGHRERSLPLGIPRIFELRPEDDHAVHASLTIKRVMARSEDENTAFPEYSTFRPIVKDIWEERPESELEELEAELKRLSESDNV